MVIKMTCDIESKCKPCHECGQIVHGELVDEGYGSIKCTKCDKVVESYAPM